MAEPDTVTWEIRQLVRANLFPDEASVLRRALRALFAQDPGLRQEMIVRAYAAGDISIERAAALLGVSAEEAKDVIREAGAELHLGPEDAAEALEDAGHA